MRYSSKWPEYARQWDAMKITSSRLGEMTRLAQFALDHKAQYVEVEKATGVPWWLVAVLHRRESDADFKTYLGNGDPLSRRTTHVPAGRGPFPTFVAGAIDALKMDGLSNVIDWRLEKALYYCEAFNGWGYANRGLPSSYIFGGTSIQKPGKYVSDGVWSSTTMDSQPGCAPILAMIANLDTTVKFVRESADEAPPPHVSIELAPLDLGHAVKRVMQERGFPWFKDQNVVSVERMDRNGTPNALGPNTFRDIKMVLDGAGKIISGPHTGTTHPGRYWTVHPMASGGAFIIALGSQACWTPGDYHGHTVWRQAEDSIILGHRDPNCTYARQGPPVKHFDIGVHHHGGYNLPRQNISNAGAGCQIIEFEDAQQEFMDITMQCPRYLADKHGYRMTAAVLPAEDVVAAMQPAPPAVPPPPDIAPVLKPPQPSQEGFFVRLLRALKGQ